MHRELSQCENGQCLEKIEGDQISKATFTLLPMEGTCKFFESRFAVIIFCSVSENSTLDIVREVAFISADGGETWTAEVRNILYIVD